VPLKIEAYGRTDIGLVRSGNEDFLHIDEPNRVYAVCDGMGGHQAGEVASMLAGETIGTAFGSFSKKLLSATELDLGRVLPPSCELLLKSIRLANRAIYNAALIDTGKSGMGTTVVAVALESDIMAVAHVGDSRAYRLNSEGLEPLTTDHSWVEEMQAAQQMTKEEAGSFVGKNVITRALGVRENVEIDCRLVKVKPGDMFMLCSDGLCGFADDDEIFAAVRSHLEEPGKITDELVQMANDRGGADNVTVITLRVTEVADSPLPELDKFTQPAEPIELQKIEDGWVEELQSEIDKDTTEKVEKIGRKPSRLPVVLIVIAFVIIATLIIYYAGDI